MSKQCAAQWGVFVRAYGWQIRWLDTDDCIDWQGYNHGPSYEVERLKGFLAFKNSEGRYSAIPITDDDMLDPYQQEGRVWIGNFLHYGQKRAFAQDNAHILGAPINLTHDSYRFETVELPSFRSVRALREYLLARKTRRTAQVIDPDTSDSEEPIWFERHYKDGADWLQAHLIRVDERDK